MTDHEQALWRVAVVLRRVLQSRILGLTRAQRERFRRERRRLNGSERAKRLRQQERKRELVEFVRNVPCLDCGSFYPGHMEFDHVPGRGEKKFHLGDAPYRSWVEIFEELEKCDVVCCRCHDRREKARGRSHSGGRRPCPNAFGPGGCLEGLSDPREMIQTEEQEM